MTEINNKIVTTYFKHFWRVNIFATVLFLLVRVLFSQSDTIFIWYLIFMSFLYLCASVNFELRRPHAGVGFTLLLLFVSRIAIPPSIRNGVGAFGETDISYLMRFNTFITSNSMIEIFAIIGLMGGFFLVWDHKIASDKSRIIHN